VLDLPDVVRARVRAAGARPSVPDKMIEDSASGAAPVAEGGAAGTGDSKHDEVNADEPADKNDAKCEVEATAEAEAGAKAENKAEAAASPAPEEKELEEIGKELEEIEQMKQRLERMEGERLDDKGEVVTARLATRAGSEDEHADSAGSSEGDAAAGKSKGGDVGGAAASAGTWACLACTLINSAGLDACGVCGTRLGLGAKRARVPVLAFKAGTSSNTARADEAGVSPTDENMKPGEKSGEEPPARKRTQSGTSTGDSELGRKRAASDEGAQRQQPGMGARVRRSPKQPCWTCWERQAPQHPRRGDDVPVGWRGDTDRSTDRSVCEAAGCAKTCRYGVPHRWNVSADNPSGWRRRWCSEHGHPCVLPCPALAVATLCPLYM
jgi:hypothetical protein